jgi:hypothetical protein
MVQQKIGFTRKMKMPEDFPENCGNEKGCPDQRYALHKVVDKFWVLAAGTDRGYKGC